MVWRGNFVVEINMQMTRNHNHSTGVGWWLAERSGNRGGVCGLVRMPLASFLQFHMVVPVLWCEHAISCILNPPKVVTLICGSAHSSPRIHNILHRPYPAIKLLLKFCVSELCCVCWQSYWISGCGGSERLIIMALGLPAHSLLGAVSTGKMGNNWAFTSVSSYTLLLKGSLFIIHLRISSWSSDPWKCCVKFCDIFPFWSALLQWLMILAVLFGWVKECSQSIPEVLWCPYMNLWQL
jgi:hypothetical protein